jgi:hypothetical protein
MSGASSSNSLQQVLTSRAWAPAPTVDATPPPDTRDDLVSFDGRFHHHIRSALVTHDLLSHASALVLISLINSGANQGMAGNDARILSETSFNKANVTGIGESLI